MKQVAAVVVTYNRLQDLKQCIISLQGQTRRPDALYIVDNGSTDGTGEWLSQQPGLTVFTQSNLGGAGGFARGIKHAFEDGYEWLWCMDDDCLASPNALEQLISSPDLGPCIKNCISINNQNREELAFYVHGPKTLRYVAEMTSFDLICNVASLFNGTMIHSEIVRTIGIPDAKLFIWGDESEYMTRVQKAGFPIVTIPKSILYHPPCADRDGIPWPGAWKNYYRIRNERRVFQNQHGDKYGFVMYAIWSIQATAKQLISNRKNKAYNFLLYAEATLDSLFNNFGKRPDTILTLRLYRHNHK